jgi:hypothetical protein
MTEKSDKKIYTMDIVFNIQVSISAGLLTSFTGSKLLMWNVTELKTHYLTKYVLKFEYFLARVPQIFNNTYITLNT